MLLKDELVEMKWSSANKRRYVELGYEYTKRGDSFYPKAEDVLKCSSGAKIPVRCDYCGKTFYPTSRNYEKLHKVSTIDCCVACRSKKIKQTMLDKYGVTNAVYIPEVRDKMKETCLERYGAETSLHNPEIFQKTQDSLNEHYGISDGIKNLRSVKEINDKVVSTMIDKYGGKAPLCSYEIKCKANATMASNGTCKTSKPQIMLCDMIKEIYGNCELNYPCDNSILDCMSIIDGVHIDIEYDGWYWHKDKQHEDMKRDFFVESQGYKVIRFIAHDNRLPTHDELATAINKITTTDRKFTKVELNKI